MLRASWVLVTSVVVFAAACTSSSPAGRHPTGQAGADDDSPTAAGATGTGGDTGSAGDSGSAGDPGSASTGSAGDSAGAPGDTGAAGDTGDTGAAGDTGQAPPLPAGTLLYVREETASSDLLVALDLSSGDERVITDLTSDGSTGWDIWGYSLSPDRRRIALASLYGPTKADTATGLATRAIWTLDTEGRDFLRLTPTFPNESAGRQGFQYDVGGPEWTSDGGHVLFDFGTYWWENTELAGGSWPWIVAADGSEPPASIDITSACSVLHPSRNPVTGEFLLIHSVCVPGQGKNGLFLYPPDGAEPTQLVESTRAADGIDVYLEKVSWFSDGTGFLFIGSTADTDWSPSLLMYDRATSEVSVLLPSPAGASIVSAAISPDAAGIVYGLRDDETGSQDLRLIDLNVDPPSDTALTNDGKSRAPSF